MKLFNHCGLYLRCEFLSDICTANGTELAPETLHQHSPTSPSKPLPHDWWPIQECPDAKTWTKFRSILRKLYTKHNKSNSLRILLGPWNQHHAARRREAYWNPTTNQALIAKQSRWYIADIDKTNTKQLKFSTIKRTNTPRKFTHLIPADIIHHRFTQEIKPATIHTRRPQAPPSLHDTFIIDKAWETQLIGTSLNIPPTSPFHSAFQIKPTDPTATIVIPLLTAFDGAFYRLGSSPNQGAFAWTIAPPSEIIASHSDFTVPPASAA